MLEKGKKVGEYVLLEKLGAGGFGDVWKAEKRTVLDVNHFALKFFRPKEDKIDFDKIGKELAVWKQLRGLPHIISVIELDRFEDYVYVVSDFADGGSLETFLNKNGKAQTESEAVQIALEILTGLENLHGKGFVHRDLKPDNILIMNGRFCLADFGISREIKTHSKATGTAGTMEYMPPEAFEKTPSITQQTDIWAVGAILQRLLTGNLPYPQDEQPSLIAAILMSEPDEMPESVSESLRSIVKKALQKKREKRFQSASEMREVLRNILKGSQKIVSNQSSLQAKTLLLEDSDKTAKLEIEPTKDWREIEAEKERQRKLEEARHLEEIEFQRQQAEITRLERERAERLAREEEKLVISESENERRESEAKTIRGTIIAIFAIVLITMITAALWTKPWETSNPTIANKSVNQSVNNAANKVSNTVSNQPASNITNTATNIASTTVTPRIEFVDVTMQMYFHWASGDTPSPSAEKKVKIQTSEKNTFELTDKNGKVSFFKLSCGQSIIIEVPGEQLWEENTVKDKLKRNIPCNKEKIINLGRFYIDVMDVE